MPLRHIPNLLSTFRIILVIPVVWTLLQGQLIWSLSLFILAGLTDLLDGWLARRQHWDTRVGGFLDAIADKILLIAVYISLWWLEIIPAWLLGLIIGRDMLIIVCTLLYRLQLKRLDPAPSKISKINTFMQISLAVLGINQLGLWPIPTDVLQNIMYTVVITIVLSTLGYINTWYHDVKQAHEAQHTT